MFHAIVEANRLQNGIDAIKQLVPESKINLNEDGFSVNAVDAANVGMVYYRLDADEWESYEADGGLIGLDLERFSDVLDTANKGQLADITLDPETRKLDVKIGGMTYTIGCLDPDTIRQQPEEPDIDLAGQAVLTGDKMSQVVKSTKMVGSVLEMGCGPSEEDDGDEEVFFIRSSGDTDSVSIEYGEEDLINFEYADVKSKFSVEYVENVFKPANNGTEITINIGDNVPIEFKYILPDESGDVTYMLAPRLPKDQIN